jgi:hypothetical protein
MSGPTRTSTGRHVTGSAVVALHISVHPGPEPCDSRFRTDRVRLANITPALGPSLVTGASSGMGLAKR